MTVQFTLLVSTFFALIAAGLYAHIGWWLNKRIISSPEARLAWQSFTVWWYALAVTTLVGGIQNLFGALGQTDLALFVTASYINILIICVALWSLLYYLIYLVTGNSRSLVPLIIFYMVYYIFLVYYVTFSSPNSVEIGRWNTTLIYRNTPSGPFFIILAVLLLLPQVIGGLAYFTLYFRVSDVTQKYRILLVSLSIIIWFLSPMLALAGGLSQQDWWQLASRLIGLCAALAILMAYLPPRWLRQRYGIVSLNDENQRA